MARGGPADFLACRELLEASVGLRILYLELRPHTDMRHGPIVDGATEGEVLGAMAAGVRVHLRPREADELATEGKSLGLFEVRERPREGGAPGELEWVLAVAPLPPSVYRARYADRRGPRGGKSTAERSRVYREEKKKAVQGGQEPREERPSAPPLDPVDDEDEAHRASSERPSSGPSNDSNRDGHDPVTAPVTEITRDTSRKQPVTAPGPGVALSPPPGTPFRGGAGEGGADTPRTEPPKGGGTGPEKRSWEETGRWALELLSQGTEKALDASAVRSQARHLGRAVLDRKWGAPELELVAAWLRAEPTAWRAELPKAKGALLLTVEHLLGEKVDNASTGSGLAALVARAKEWDRRRSVTPRPGPVAAGEAPKSGERRMTRAEIEAAVEAKHRASGGV